MVEVMLSGQSIPRFHFRMAITVLLFYYSVLLLFSRSFLQDPDTLWHIRTGQWILDHGSVPVVDSYSYTASGQRWISGQWLAEIIFYLAYRLGEWRGIVILSTLLCAAIIATLCRYLLRNLRFSVAIAWTAITAVAISPHFLARPHLFSYLLILVWVSTLVDSYDRTNFKPPTLFLCVIIVIWANLHGSFTLGLVFLGVFVIYSCYRNALLQDYATCRRDLILLIIVGVCALVTPYGIFSALLTLEVKNLKYALKNISEWHTPDFQQQRIHLFLFVSLLMALVGLGIRVRGPRLIVFGIILVLGLSHTRGLVILFLLMPVILARPLNECLPWFRPVGTNILPDSQTTDAFDPILFYLQRRSSVIASVFLSIAVLVTAVSWHRTNVGPPESVAPKKAIEFVRRAGITGNVFNSFNFGGYLIFSGIPTFIDGRIPPYSDDFVRRTFEAVQLADIDDSFRLLDEYKVNWVILRPVEPLTKALARSGLWDEIYSDKYSVVFLRRE
jgi:hypothetical protein